VIEEGNLKKNQEAMMKVKITEIQGSLDMKERIRIQVATKQEL
jgi:hypothetical protein